MNPPSYYQDQARARPGRGCLLAGPVMSERAFLDAIVAEPDEDAHRLVFADWLDEHGQSERAEFIQAQCELAKLPQDDARPARLHDGDPRRTDLEVRERRLLAAQWRRFSAAPRPAWPGTASGR